MSLSGRLGWAAAMAVAVSFSFGCRTGSPVVGEPVPGTPVIGTPVPEPIAPTPPPVVEEEGLPGDPLEFEEDAMLPDPTPRPPRLSKDTAVKYTVKKGDVLSRIAVRHGVRLRELMELNQIKDQNRIRVGQVIYVPAGAKKAAPGTSKPSTRKATARAPKPGEQVYTIQRGDSLSEIAHAHGVTVSALRAANGLTGDVIVAGRTLIIPAGATKNPAPAPAAPAEPAVVPAAPAAPTAPAASVPEMTVDEILSLPPPVPQPAESPMSGSIPVAPIDRPAPSVVR